LLKNYNNFRDLTIKYEDSSTSKDEVAEIIKDSQIFIWILISIVVLPFMAIILIIIKIENTVMLIYDVIEKIPLSKLQ